MCTAGVCNSAQTPYDFRIYLVVSTHSKNISQIESFPQVGVKVNSIWNHHLVSGYIRTVFGEHVAKHMVTTGTFQHCRCLLTHCLGKKASWDKLQEFVLWRYDVYIWGKFTLTMAKAIESLNNADTYCFPPCLQHPHILLKIPSEPWAHWFYFQKIKQISIPWLASPPVASPPPANDASIHSGLTQVRHNLLIKVRSWQSKKTPPTHPPENSPLEPANVRKHQESINVEIQHVSKPWVLEKNSGIVVT